MSRARSKKPAEGEVTVYLVGASHNGKAGDARNVPPERAEHLIRHGLAISQEEAEARLARDIRS